MTINTRLSFINITRSDKVIWNIVKNLLVPVWWCSDGRTIDIQLIPVTAIIVLLVLL